MPWNDDRYPVSMKNLPQRVRHKAIEIANALLEEGYDEGRCIRIAIGRAKRWGAGPIGVMAGAKIPLRRHRTAAGSTGEI